MPDQEDEALLTASEPEMPASWHQPRADAEQHADGHRYDAPESEDDKRAALRRHDPRSAKSKSRDGLKPGQTVRLEGWLVEARAPDGWRWLRVSDLRNGFAARVGSFRAWLMPSSFSISARPRP